MHPHGMWLVLSLFVRTTDSGDVCPSACSECNDSLRLAVPCGKRPVESLRFRLDPAGHDLVYW